MGKVLESITLKLGRPLIFPVSETNNMNLGVIDKKESVFFQLIMEEIYVDLQHNSRHQVKGHAACL